MELVSFNSEPIFGEGDEYEDVDCSMVEHCGEAQEMQLKKQLLPPTVGLEFESFDEAYDFYNVYAKGQGFGIRVSNSWFRSKQRERYRAKLSCSNAGFKKKSEANNPRPETRTGCPAMVIIKLVGAQRWRIVEVELEHNHPVSPEIKRFYKSHKKMFLAAKKAQQSEPVKEIHTIKLYRNPVVDNGHSKIDERDDRNTVGHSKHLNLKEGDAHAVYNYFCRMKLTNPNFFYLMDIDDEGHLNNIFWADARSRIAYNYFSDTITIDTTSLTNKYEIPLISFVGINHHGQSVLVGCGILGHESVECLIWMFSAWLTCMLGQHPQVIVTDQSKPLHTAVSEVFPQARHCYCLSYIMHRVPEKLGGLNGFEAIKRQLNKAVFNSLKISEFETFWGEMINQHNLIDNKWLQLLYQDRQRWVPVYLKDTCFMGMLPINESEVVPAAFFDGYVHKHTSLKEFLDKYDLALQRKHLKEAMEDLESSNSNFVLKTKSKFEVQLSKVYTREMFERCQSEVEGMYSCFHVKQVASNGQIMTFVVKERKEVEGKEEVRQYEVVYGTTQIEVRCICSLFNFKGYLCRHALNVLNYNGVEEIPDQYVLPRWSKGYKRDFSFDDEADHLLSRRALQLVEEGAVSQHHYHVLMQQLDSLLTKFSLMDENSM